MPTNVYDALGQLGTTIAQLPGQLVDAVSSAISETQYEQTQNSFPSDLGSEQNAHYVKMVAYTGGSTSTGGFSPPNFPQWIGRLPIGDSSTGGSMPLIYDHHHNFADIRLTNIINDSLLGITAQMAFRRSLNPMVQVLYRSTDLRQFTFGFMLSPENEEESRQIELIQRMLRAYSAPEINQMVVIPPAEWEFSFYRGGQPNPHLPRIHRCIISNVTVDYGPAGSFTAFRNAQPQAVKILFIATEIRVIDRNLILNGEPADGSGYGNIGF